jgi:hypothetical protein
MCAECVPKDIKFILTEHRVGLPRSWEKNMERFSDKKMILESRRDSEEKRERERKPRNEVN